MTANEYAASLTMTPQYSGLNVSWDLALKVRLPTGVSKVMPSSAAATLLLSVLSAFLMPSTSATIDS